MKRLRHRIDSLIKSGGGKDEDSKPRVISDFSTAGNQAVGTALAVMEEVGKGAE